MALSKTRQAGKCPITRIPSGTRSYWEYVVNDYLETGCLLPEKQRHFLLQQLRVEDLCIDSVEVHHTFSISRRLVVIADTRRMHQCWIYYPRLKRIEKHMIQPGG